MKILTIALSLLTAMRVSAAPDSTVNQLQVIVAEAKTWQGTPYRYNGNSRSGIDCSHFVFSIYSKVVPDFNYRMAREYLNDNSFTQANLSRAGDLIVFPGYRSASDHVGIVTDPQGLKFIGSQTSTGVAETSFAAKSYWGKRPYRIMHLKTLPEKPAEKLLEQTSERQMVLPSKH